MPDIKLFVCCHQPTEIPNHPLLVPPQVGIAAQIPKEKATPRCLRKLYQTTRANVEANIALQVERAIDQQIELEQLAVG